MRSRSNSDSSVNSDSSADARNAALRARTPLTAHNTAFLQNLLERLPLHAGQLAALLDLVKRGYIIRVAKTVLAFIKAHRWQIFWSLTTLVGLVLIINPVALMGFGALGPIAGSAAALWQAAIGNVAAGSLFAVLQSIGMVHFATIPLVGLAVAGGGAVALAKVAGVLQPASRWVQTTSRTAWQWLRTRSS
ncbi:hypothetical protein B0H16DRAFT_324327 [Mycena metata]|uniref:Uncharacterized protein n=1 Tax=Mycena metata TaxID=1033252 RepID=A0AAD7HP52_9AGAR|nr:hypothetical protein B0H16DRAFT_324327 [Mycena metata]